MQVAAGAQWIAWVATDEEVATWTGCLMVLLLVLTTYDVIGPLMIRRDGTAGDANCRHLVQPDACTCGRLDGMTTV
ncbi:hypothetical protein BJF82_04935 [Kytococcus sp. CUA-901]|nr:hypothetical protein BJF82_04935 [Kytococcus sp. CUA-901]